jgi:Tol biopolymer transport system component
MSATRNVAGLGRGRLAAALLLVAALGMGLAACRGFFGQAPIALLVTDAGGDGEVPVTVTFDISASNDPDGVIATYELDFGDGSTEATGTDVTVPIVHEYEENGTFTIVLTVTDNDGRIGMANTVVTIGPVMIAFASDRIGDYDIYRMKADGTDLVSLGSVNATVDDELFPDLVQKKRDRIAYTAEDGTSWNIWTMTVGGGSRTQLTTKAASNQIQPDWSVDASTIAYASNQSGEWEIHTMTSLGTSQQKVTSQSPSWAIAPVFSPLNDDFLFVSDKTATGGSAIWLWDDSAGSASELYDDDGRDGDASPVTAIVPATTALDLPADAGTSRPTWSPDGTKIAFARERTAGGIIDIYVMDADGTGAESLEDYVEALGVLNTGITTDDDEFAPSWLEDDSGIAFVKEDSGGDFQIHVVDFATGVVSELTETENNVLPAAKR